MGGLEGASLAVKLDYIESWNNKRRSIAKKYHKQIINPKVKMQVVPDYADGVHHLFVVTVEDRQAFVDHLAKNDINAAYHYPIPCHLQKAYSYLGHKKGDFPKSEYLASHCISLPMYAELTDSQVDKVIRIVNLY
jgi:dTDP-4-amino-4,6-dideoxygalactose transaminase